MGDDLKAWDHDLADRFMLGESVAEASKRTGVRPECVEKALRERLGSYDPFARLKRSNKREEVIAGHPRKIMAQLFRVNVEVELVVVAKDQRDAERAAEALVSVEDGGADVYAVASALTDKRQLPSGWDDSNIPFNSDDDKRIGEYLSSADGLNAKANK